MDRVLRITDIVKQLRISRATIYRQMDAGTFPKPIRLGLRCVGWTEQQIQEWLVSRPVSMGNRGEIYRTAKDQG